MEHTIVAVVGSPAAVAVMVAATGCPEPTALLFGLAIAANRPADETAARRSPTSPRDRPENVSIERAPQPSMAAPLSGCRPIVYFRHPCP